MRVGLFFGSFNPIHNGHMAIAQTIIDHGQVDELWFVLSPQNPLKKNKTLLHEFDRMDMVQAAVHDNPKLKTTDVEFNLPKPSYTIKTLTVLADRFPDHDFSLIIGEDNLANFHKWKNHQSILEHFDLIVYPRPKAAQPKFDIEAAKIHFIKAPLLDISATFIRDQIKNGHSIKYLVPIEVAEFINSKKFYQ